MTDVAPKAALDTQEFDAISHDAAKTVNEASQKAAARAAELRQAFEERATAAREWAADQGDVLRDTVQTKPFIAIGISAASAFAAGLVLGVLLTRR